jgi:hypothetical protein
MTILKQFHMLVPFSMICYVSYGMYSFVDVHHPFRMIRYELQFALCCELSKRTICYEFANRTIRYEF